MCDRGGAGSKPLWIKQLSYRLQRFGLDAGSRNERRYPKMKEELGFDQIRRDEQATGFSLIAVQRDRNFEVRPGSSRSCCNSWPSHFFNPAQGRIRFRLCLHRCDIPGRNGSGRGFAEIDTVSEANSTCGGHQWYESRISRGRIPVGFAVRTIVDRSGPHHGPDEISLGPGGNPGGKGPRF
jgi:hypothetical protein